MFKRILVPVDSSRSSQLGLDTAIKLAKSTGAMLRVLHVVDPAVFALGGDIAAFAYADRVYKELRLGGKRLLARAAAAAARRGIRPSAVLIENRDMRRVAGFIVAHARTYGADLIVLGTHGRQGMKRLVMGSDAEDVVRRAPVPVLLVRSAPRRGSR